MLLIKKKAILVYIKCNFSILTRHNLFKNIKKQKRQNITLRSPKHFNIGKFKIYNLNYKYAKIIMCNDLNFNSKRLLSNTNELFYFKHCVKNPLNIIKHISVVSKLNLKILIMW